MFLSLGCAHHMILEIWSLIGQIVEALFSLVQGINRSVSAESDVGESPMVTVLIYQKSVNI